MLRDLRVDIDAIIDARLRSTDDPVEPYLDLKTGEVVLSVDEAISGEPDEVGAILDDEPDRLVFIERAEGSAGWRRMSDFAAQVGEEDVRAALQAALEGRGAFAAFGERLAAIPIFGSNGKPPSGMHMRARSRSGWKGSAFVLSTIGRRGGAWSPRERAPNAMSSGSDSSIFCCWGRLMERRSFWMDGSGAKSPPVIRPRLERCPRPSPAR